ncbi:MAG: imidazole glycerol phosphate synthase subunit HisH [Planctomycetes bacterium]|nr:imidazole glycerol phosphate synthase subunit HisH [Planctomycetota bacterium]
MIVVMDYGVGNVKSVTNAVKYIGCDVKVSCEPEDIAAADGIILPGVGACGYAMEAIGDLADTIRQIAASGKPLLGICLGYQLLFDENHEHGIHKCLGLISGKVIPIPPGLTIPHMGWNLVEFEDDMRLFEGLGKARYFPFAHSYYAEISDPLAKVAYTEYGVKISASVQKGNIYGCQFHPEKSGNDGLQILKNFENICKSKP